MTPSTTGIYTLSLHDALPIWEFDGGAGEGAGAVGGEGIHRTRRGCDSFSTFWMRKKKNHIPFLYRSEEHTSELQSHSDLVCRLLLEKKKSEGFRARTCSAPVV